ncbi:mannanase [Mycena epipterygia]|nr:mannanase [Mycena epipterygia]
MLRQVFLLAFLAGSSFATVAEFGQCGGIGYTGDTVCATGFVCTVLNDWFFQCLPPTATTTTASTTTTTVSTATSTATSSTPTSTSAPPSATGFVTTSGTKFMLNGAKYTVVGSNAYWPALLGYSSTDIDKAFADIAASGATTVRGFNEVTSPTGVYFHFWSGSTATVNTGANGLGALDVLIASAKAHGIRVIIALTNNWSDFGGMDVYTAQILGSGQPHDAFFTNPTAAYKTYVNAVVSRYVNEPTVMVSNFPLANEPRCAGTTTVASATCNTITITNWASNISAFIKSIDRNHLVAIGDEGFFNEPTSPDFVYQGTLGVDFAANMKISTLDFGTFHMYPDSWGETANDTAWGSQWITDHATVMKAQNKPAIMEEFGLTTSTRNSSYATWYSTVLSSGLTGDLIWQAGSVLSNGPTPNDGYAIYPTDPVYSLIKSHAAALIARG